MSVENIITIVVSSILSIIVSVITTKQEYKTNFKKERFERFYKKFYVLRDEIHQGCAYDFVDLSSKDQERIIQLLIETDCYQDEELTGLVYELKTSRLNFFTDRDELYIKKCNDAYNQICKIVNYKYMSYINKKYYSKE